MFPLGDLREHYQPLIGRETTLGELQQYTQRLTQRYRQKGYLLSYAYLPPQDVADGRVDVVLVEGYVRDYHVEGDIGPANEYLQQLLARIEAERPLSRETLERYLGLATRMPGVVVEAELAMARAADGVAQLTVHARRKQLSAAVTVADSSRDAAQALITVASNAQTRHGERVTASWLLPLAMTGSITSASITASTWTPPVANCCCRRRATAASPARAYVWTMAAISPASTTVSAMRSACVSRWLSGRMSGWRCRATCTRSVSMMKTGWPSSQRLANTTPMCGRCHSKVTGARWSRGVCVSSVPGSIRVWTTWGTQRC